MPETIDEIATRHGFSTEAVRAMAEALRRGGGRMAQFNHPDFGGMGQWAAGGMIMIGDMFNNTLKERVDALCRDLAALCGPLAATAETEPKPDPGWWPAELGTPAATGAQNEMRYAFFPERRRLAVRQNGQVHVYDSGDHLITGFGQQQSAGQSLQFTSQHGLVRLEELKEA